MEFRAREYEMIATKLLEDSERRSVLLVNHYVDLSFVNFFKSLSYKMNSLEKKNNWFNYVVKYFSLLIGKKSEK